MLSANLACLADYRSAVLSHNPVGYWPLDETASVLPVVATNIGTIGATGHGVLRNDLHSGGSGALASQGASNSSVRCEYYLEGNRVRIPYSSVWNTNGDFSVEFWCKPGQTNFLACPAASVEFADPSTNQVVRRGWLLYQGQILADGSDHGNGWIFRIYHPPSGAAAQQTSLSFAMTLDTNKWYHIVGTYKSAPNNQRALTLFVNGAQVATTGFPGGPGGTYENVKTNTIPLTFGARADGAAGYWTYSGLIDEPAFYPFLLAPAQITQHYQAGTNVAPATPYHTTILSHSPAGYWRLNETTGLPAANLGSSLTAGEYLHPAVSGTVAGQPPEFTGFSMTNRAVTISPSIPGNPASVRVAPLPINTNTVTITAWIKPNGPQSPYAGILTTVSVPDDITSYSGLNIGPSGGLQIGYGWNNELASFDFPSAVTVPDGQWSFVAVAVAPDHAVIFAHDGNTFLVDSNVVPHVSQSFGGYTRIGKDPLQHLYVPPAVFNGDIDEVAIFDRTLTIGELYDLYAAGKGGLPPIILQDVVAPSGLAEGETLSLTVEAGGTPALGYSWRKNGAPIPGATSKVYTKPNLTLADEGGYDVVITNAFGTNISSVATVLIQNQSAPNIAVQPVGATVYQNGYVNLSVTATGGGLQYRWLRNSTLVPGATSASYVISPAAATNAGTYTVIVSNTINSVLSDPAVVNVVVPSPGSYAATIVADSPTSWWRLDEAPGSSTIQDAMGRNHGMWSLSSAPTLGAAGVSSGNSAAYFPPGANAYGFVPYSLALNNLPLTVECWVYVTNILGAQTPVSSWAATPADRGYLFYLDENEWRVLNAYSDALYYAPLGPVISGRWTHLVFTMSPVDGLRTYLNGEFMEGPYSTAGFLPNNNPDYPLHIGVDVPGAGSWDNYFEGIIDEVAVYPEVLSPSRIFQHYQTALYSSNTPPVFLTQPVSQTVVEGSDVNFSAIVEGSQPIIRQWSKNGTPISGATNATLTLNNVGFADGGSYRLSATNSAGASNSAPATLSVVGAPTYANATNGLVLHLKFDGNYLDATGRGNHGYPSNSPALVPGKIGPGALSYVTTSNLPPSFVNLGIRPDLQFGTSTDFSVAFWTKFNGTPGDLPFFCNSDTSLSSEGYTIAPSYQTGTLGWSLDTYRFEGGPNLNDNAWHHVAVSINRNGNAVSYVDGQVVDTRLGTATDLNTPFATVIGQTGSYNYSEVGAFQLDDLGVWRRELSAIEAYSIYYVGQTYGRSFDQFGPVLLVIRPNGNNLELIWQSGTLQQADNVDGPWSNVGGATAPYHSVAPSGQRKFYRVQL